MPDPPERRLCYLCANLLTEPVTADHIPAKGLFPPEIRRRHNPSKLITISVHEACNRSYQFDEEYFIYSLYPFALGMIPMSGTKCESTFEKNFAPKRIVNLAP